MRIVFFLATAGFFVLALQTLSEASEPHADAETDRIVCDVLCDVMFTGLSGYRKSEGEFPSRNESSLRPTQLAINAYRVGLLGGWHAALLEVEPCQDRNGFIDCGRPFPINITPIIPASETREERLARQERDRGRYDGYAIVRELASKASETNKLLAETARPIDAPPIQPNAHYRALKRLVQLAQRATEEEHDSKPNCN